MKPGIYRDFDVRAYHNDPCPKPSLNQSTCKVLLDTSPLHAAWQHPRLKRPAVDEKDYDKAKAIGDAAHSLMIGRGKGVAIGEFDDWRTKEAKAFKANSIAHRQIAILQKHFDQAHAIVRVGKDLLARHEAKDCFQNGAGEVALIWQEEDLWFRCLVDWLHDDLRTADDYKTTGLNIAEHNLGRVAADAGWHIQAAMIERGLNALDPENVGRRRFRFIAQEQDPPHCLTVMRMDEYWLTMGRKQLQAAVDIWRACMESDQWPGYPLFMVTPTFPGWRETQWLDREMAHESRPILISLAGG